MIQRTFLKAVYKTTVDDWETIAQIFETKGETRMASTIRAAVAKQLRGWREATGQAVLGVAFRDGSVAKMDRFVLEDKQ